MPKVALLCFVSKASIFFPLLHEVVALLIWELGLSALWSAVFSCIRTILCWPVVNRFSALQCSGNAKKPDHEKNRSWKNLCFWMSACTLLSQQFLFKQFNLHWQLLTQSQILKKFVLTNMQMGVSEYAWAQTPMEAWSVVSFWLWFIKNSFKIRSLRRVSYNGTNGIYISTGFLTVQCWEPSHLWHGCTLHPSPALMLTVHLFNIYFLFSLIISFLLPSFYRERISVGEHPDSFETYNFRSLWAFT